MTPENAEDVGMLSADERGEGGRGGWVLALKSLHADAGDALGQDGVLWFCLYFFVFGVHVGGTRYMV